jgi:hypothetical protein
MLAAAVRSVAMGDDETLRRRSTVPSLLRYESQYESSSTQQTRSKGGKVTTNEIRRNVVRRVDVGAEIVVMKLAVAQMTRGEFQVWIALKEGILFRPALSRFSREIAPRTWFVIPPPAKSATIEQVAQYYGYTESSVKRMDQSARKLLNELRERAGLMKEIPDVPIWPAVNSDERILAYLFGKGG